MAIEIDLDEVNAAIQELTSVTGIDEPDEELVTAANFVFKFGALGDFLEEPNLTAAQFWTGPPGAAFGLIGHWSAERNDPVAVEPGRSFEVHAEACKVCSFLESTLTSRGVFEFETCNECSGDIEAHAVVALPIGQPGLMCVGQWQRTEPAAVNAGSVNSNQIGDGYAASWWAPLEDGTFAVVTRTYFIAPVGRGTMLFRDDEYTICHDPGQPDTTEIVSTANVVDLESDDPQMEDLQQLATDSFPPDPGEWEEHGPEDSPMYAVPVPA